MSRKSRIVVFDFDGTLIKDDSFLFLLRKYGKPFFKKAMLRLLFFVYDRHFIDNFLLKKLVFRYIIRNVRIVQLLKDAQLMADYIVSNGLLNNILLLKLKNHLSQGDKVIILTASPEIVVEEILKNILGRIPRNLQIIGTKLQIDGDNCIRGVAFNCYGKNKVKVLKKMSIDRIDIFFTDSEEDLPLALKAKKVLKVDKNSWRLEEWIIKDTTQ